MNTLQETQNEANKCLNCKNPMCQKGCPISTHIPQFISEIKNNNLEEAYKILQENNIMSDVCSNVCPYEECCVGNCIKGINGEPIQVNKLEKYVNNWARENNVVYVNDVEKKNNIKIAIIGSGPAGIECGVELAKKGYEVTIFEKEKQIGGLLTYGIPGFRLPRNITRNLTQRLEDLNIKIKTEIEFGKDISLERLKKTFKAIFVGIGADIPSTYQLTNKKCDRIYKSNYILKEYNAKRIVENLGDVIVIGGGNVATDSARAAIRMGAKSSTIVYRRDHSKMPARKVELDEAMQDGVKVIYNTRVIDADVENSKIKNINCIKTNSTTDKVVDIENSEFKIKADSVIFAIGLKPDKNLIKNQGLEITEQGLIRINENYMTNVEGVFAGGDVIQSKATVCKAIENGKKAAEEINKYIIQKGIIK